MEISRAYFSKGKSDTTRRAKARTGRARRRLRVADEKGRRVTIMPPHPRPHHIARREPWERQVDASSVVRRPRPRARARSGRRHGENEREREEGGRGRRTKDDQTGETSAPTATACRRCPEAVCRSDRPRSRAPRGGSATGRPSAG